MCQEITDILMIVAKVLYAQIQNHIMTDSCQDQRFTIYLNLQRVYTTTLSKMQLLLFL
jgi:hypothetical protein